MGTVTSEHETDERLNQVASLVRQLFFGLIARVVPGVFIMTLLVLTTCDVARIRAELEAWQQSWVSTAAIVALAALVAYVISVASFGVWYILWRSCWFVFWLAAWVTYWGLRSLVPAHLWSINGDATPRLNLFWDRDTETGIPNQRAFNHECDAIKATDATVGHRLAKLKASIHMTQVLIAGCLPAAGGAFLNQRHALLVGTVALVVSLFGARGYITRRCRNLIIDRTETRASA